MKSEEERCWIPASAGMTNKENPNMDPSYTLRKSKRARRMRLSVYCDGSVVVTAPQGAEMGVAEKFVADKKKWILKKIEQFKSSYYTTVRAGSKKEYQEHRIQALQLAYERMQHFNEIYGFSFNRVSIRNQKTRWGSCSSKKNININYRILFLPKAIQDYIVVHELCHLKEMNHSRRFWSLVQKVLPDYLETRKQLKGHRL